VTTPEETARQVVPSLLRPGCVRISDTAGDAWVTLRDEDDINALRKLFERVVEKAIREGAAEERERIFAAAKDKPTDLAAVAMAVAGVHGEADYARARIAEIEEQESRHRAALARSREAGYADALYSDARPTNCGTCAAALTEEAHRPDCPEPHAIAERGRVSALLRAVRRWATVARDTSGPADEQIAADIDLVEAVDALDAAPTAVAAQPSDLAARVRSLVNRYTDIWLALGTWDPEGEAAVAECLAILRGVLRAERGVLGVDSTQALLERARVDAASMPESLRGRMLTRLVAEVETAVRECEE
jgi:hypothetical protein